MLTPLTKIPSSKVNFKWTKIHQYSFDGIKWIGPGDIFLSYPGFNEEFKIQTNARKFQLVSVINQNMKLIPFYSI